MTNLLSFSGDNLGGVMQEFFFCNVNDIATIPDALLNIVTGPVLIGEGGTDPWMKGCLTIDSISYTEEKNDTDNGTVYNPVFSGFYPKDNPVVAALFNSMIDCRFVLLMKDNNGFYKLIGSINQPLTFSRKLGTSDKISGKNGYMITFSGQSSHEAFFYEGPISVSDDTINADNITVTVIDSDTGLPLSNTPAIIGDNLGAVQKFFFIPESEVLSIPGMQHNIISGTLTLKDGATWTEGFMSLDTISYTEEKTDTDHGTLYNPLLTGFCPKDTPEMAGVFAGMVNDRFLVLYNDNNGYYKLIGDINQPLTFTRKLATSDKVSGQNGYILTFSGQCNHEAYFFTGTFPAQSILFNFYPLLPVPQATGPAMTDTQITSALLTDLSIGPSESISYGDSILTAFGKIQAEINTLTSTTESSIVPGTSLQYWRGDKTWQTLNTDAVPEGTANLYYTQTRVWNDFSATAPLSYNNTTGTFSMPAAGTSQAGYMSAAAYNTMIGKVNKSGDTMSGLLILSADPSASMGAATKNYVDQLVNGLNWKHSVRASTTGALATYAVSGSNTILTGSSNGALAAQDGVTLIAGDTLLVKNEITTNRVNNGAYTVIQVGDSSHPFILTRTSDSTTGAELSVATWSIREGSTQANQTYTVNNGEVTLGTTQITFALVIGPGTYTNGAGLLLTGNVFSLDTTYIASATQTGLLSSGNWTTFNGKEPPITTGTTAQYWRGDKTWQSLNTAISALGYLTSVTLTTGQIGFGVSGVLGGDSSITYSTSSGMSTTKQYANSFGATASSPSLALTGTPYRAGTATTNKPLLLLEPTGVTSTGWNGNGNFLGINSNLASGSFITLCYQGATLLKWEGNTGQLTQNISAATYNFILSSTSTMGFNTTGVNSSVNFFNSGGNIAGNGSFYRMFSFASILFSLGTGTTVYNAAADLYVNTTFNFTNGSNTARSFFVDPIFTSAVATSKIRAIETSGGATLFGNSYPFYGFSSSLLGVGFRANASIEVINITTGVITTTPTTITDPTTTTGTFASIVGTSIDGVVYKASASGAALTIRSLYSLFVAASSASTGIAATTSWALGTNGNVVIKPTVTPSSSVATLAIGSAAYDGATSGFFNGNANGTHLAINGVSTTADFVNFGRTVSTNFKSIFGIDANGNVSTLGSYKVTGVAFANLPVPTTGMIATCTDSTVNAWGATVAGGGSNTVLAWYNGVHWTVLGS